MLITDRLAKSKNEDTQDKFIENLCNTKKLVKIYLRNGICLQGYIDFFDEVVLILKEQQLIYKSSIATIMEAIDIGK